MPTLSDCASALRAVADALDELVGEYRDDPLASGTDVGRMTELLLRVSAHMVDFQRASLDAAGPEPDDEP